MRGTCASNGLHWRLTGVYVFLSTSASIFEQGRSAGSGMSHSRNANRGSGQRKRMVMNLSKWEKACRLGKTQEAKTIIASYYFVTDVTGLSIPPDSNRSRASLSSFEIAVDLCSRHYSSVSPTTAATVP